MESSTSDTRGSVEAPIEEPSGRQPFKTLGSPDDTAAHLHFLPQPSETNGGSGGEEAAGSPETPIHTIDLTDFLGPMGTKWFEIALKVGCKDTAMQLRSSNETDPRRCFMVIDEWMNKGGENACWEYLCRDVLRSEGVGLGQLADRIERELKLKSSRQVSSQDAKDCEIQQLQARVKELEGIEQMVADQQQEIKELRAKCVCAEEGRRRAEKERIRMESELAVKDNFLHSVRLEKQRLESEYEQYRSNQERLVGGLMEHNQESAPSTEEVDELKHKIEELEARLDHSVIPDLQSKTSCRQPKRRITRFASSPSFILEENEIDLETLSWLKEEFGIDLAELDLDAVQARPRLDTTVQKSRVIVVHQVSAQRRLPAKVAQQLGSVYPKQRKLLHLMSTPGGGDKDVEPNYRTQKSAPEVLDEKPKSEEEVRERLGFGCANPPAGLAMAMKMSLQSSPGTERKSPGVDTKPAKKPDVGISTTNSPLVLTPTNEARATSTPKDAVPSPLSTPVRRTGGTPGRRVPAANDSTVSDSTLDNVSELFRKGNSRLFGDDEIEKLFSPTTTEETAEETQHTCKNVILGLKAAEVKRNSPLGGRRGRLSLSQAQGEGDLPEWKRQLQEQRAMKKEKKKNDNMTDSKVVKEATIPDWKKELLRKKKATPEPSPVTKPQEPDKEASPEELTKAKERAKDVTPPKEVPLEDVSAKSITGASAVREVVAKKPVKDAKKDSDSMPDWKKRLEERRASREREVSPALANKETLLSKSDSDKVPDWKKRLEERRASREGEVSPVSADKETLLPKDEERRPSKEERPPVPVMNKEILMAKMEELRASREKASVPVGKEALMAKSGESHTSGEEKPPLPVGKEALLAKTADTEIPEWRRRLLERKKESGSVSVPTKTVAVTSSEPEWKKRAKELRKQREAEKTAASAARAQQKDREEGDDVREWQKRMQERKEIREREKRAKEAAKKGTTQSSRALFDASITVKGPEKKPLFDSSLQADGEKGSPEKDKSAKKKENKAKIESLFADDDEVIVKQDTSSDSSRQRTQGDAAALKDWVVVGEEEVKQADKDKEEFERSVGGVASKMEVDKEEVKKGGEVKTSDSSQVRAWSTTAVKNAERKEKRDVKRNRTDNLSKQTEVKVTSNAAKSSVAKIVAFFGTKASTKVNEEFGSRESVSSEGEVFSPVCKTAPDNSDTSCKESTQASQASLISMSDTASSVPRSATISSLDSEEKEDTPPPGCVRRTSLKFSPTHDSQQQASSRVPRWKKLMSWRKNLDQDSGYMTGSASSMDSKGAEDDNVPPFMKEFQRKRANSQSCPGHRK